MSTKIFVNLPVKDLNKSVSFFTELGYTFDPQFTDENATCMIVSQDIFVMLVVENFFKTFTKKRKFLTQRKVLKLFYACPLTAEKKSMRW